VTPDKNTLTGLVIVVVFAIGFLLARVGVEQPPPSAAVTLRRALTALILAPIALVVAGALLKRWGDRREKRRKLQDALLQAEVYERLQSKPSPSRSGHRRPLPMAGGQGISIVLPDQHLPYHRNRGYIALDDPARAADSPGRHDRETLDRR
jgi:hypothetical protein